jgi:hypothetical protein
MGSVKTKIVELLLLLIALIVIINLTPTFVSTVQNLNTAGWNFTGYAAAATLIGLLPLLFIVSVVIWFMIELLTGL